MKRVIKQLAAVVLAMIMTAGMGVSAWADDVAVTAINAVNVKITRMAAGDNVTAYRLIKYDSNYNAYSIDDTGSVGFNKFLTTKKAGNTEANDKYFSSLSESETSKLLSEFVASGTYQLPNGADDVRTSTADSDGNATVLLDPGYYLMLFTTTENNSRVYNPMSVFVQVENDAVTVKDGTSDGAGGFVVAAKSQEGPTIKKTVKYGTDWKTASVAGVGDTVDFSIELTIPAYTSVNASEVSLKIEDTMTNLEYVDDSAKVYENKTSDGTFADVINDAVSVSGGSGKFVFAVDYSKLGITNATKTVYLSYQAKVLKNAADTKSGTNQAVLKYKLGHELSEKSIAAETTTVYNYALKLDKMKEDGTTPLTGAKFKVYKTHNAAGYDNIVLFKSIVDGSGTVEYYRPAVSGEVGSVSEIEASFVLKGLDEGTYYLEESTVPSGFYAPKSGMKVVLKAGTDMASGEVNGSLDAIETKIAALDSEDAGLIKTEACVNNQFDVVIKNSTHPTLPSTGGTGTMLFTIVGVAFMLAAIFMMFFRRKGKNDEK